MSLNDKINEVIDKEYQLSSTISSLYTQLKYKMADIPNIKSASNLPDTIATAKSECDRETVSRVDGSLYECNEISIVQNGKFSRDYIFTDTNISAIGGDVPLNQITSINSCSFSGCKYVSQNIVDRLSNVTSIGTRAFTSAGGFTSAYFPYLCYQYSSKNTFQWCSDLQYGIFTSLTALGDHYFDGCGFKKLTNEMFPNLHFIGWQAAFRRNYELTDIDLSSVVQIENLAFYECSKLSSVNFPNVIRIWGGDAFYNCNSLISICLPKLSSLGIYDSLKREWKCIGRAFAECNNLETVEFKNLMQINGSGNFTNCNSLISVNFPNLTSMIEGPSSTEFSAASNTFYNCQHLKFADMPNCLSIGTNTFFNCVHLLSANLSSVAELTYDMFLSAGLRHENKITVLVNQNTIVDQQLIEESEKFNIQRVS